MYPPTMFSVFQELPLQIFCINTPILDYAFQLFKWSSYYYAGMKVQRGQEVNWLSTEETVRGVCFPDGKIQIEVL